MTKAHICFVGDDAGAGNIIGRAERSSTLPPARRAPDGQTNVTQTSGGDSSAAATVAGPLLVRADYASCKVIPPGAIVRSIVAKRGRLGEIETAGWRPTFSGPVPVGRLPVRA